MFCPEAGHINLTENVHGRQISSEADDESLFSTASTSKSFRITLYIALVASALVALNCTYLFNKLRRAYLKGVLKRRFSRGIVILLSIQTTAVFVGCVIDMLLDSSPLSSLSCANLGPCLPLCYAISKTTTSEILYRRAMSTLGKLSDWYDFFWRSTRLFIITSAIISLPAIFFIWAGELYFSDEICIVLLKVPAWLMIAIAVGDFNLTLFLLGMFLKPVYDLARALNTTKTGSLLYSTAKRNLNLSATALLSSMFLYYLFGLGLTEPSEESSKQHWMLSVNWICAVDMCINLNVNFLLFPRTFNYGQAVRNQNLNMMALDRSFGNLQTKVTSTPQNQ